MGAIDRFFRRWAEPLHARLTGYRPSVQKDLDDLLTDAENVVLCPHCDTPMSREALESAFAGGVCTGCGRTITTPEGE